MKLWPAKAILFLFASITATSAYHRSESIWNDEQSDSMWDLVDDNDISWIWKTRQTIKSVNHDDFWETESSENKATFLWGKIATFFKSVFLFGSAKQDEDNPVLSKFNKSTHARVKRAQNRQLMVKCCGSQPCSDGSTANYERRQVAKDQKEKESAFVNELQYARKRKRKKRPQVNLDQLRAYGVFTAEGIHISCAGCPSGWPDMLTVYPDYEIGIPVTCSNCPNNWPGALNLLGVGGDPTWNNQQPSEGNNGGGTSNFFSFDTGSNFGGGGGAVAFPPSGPGNNGGKTDNQNYGGQDDYYSDETDSAPLARSTRPKRRGTNTAAVTGNGDDGETSKPNEDAGADDGSDDGEEEADPNSSTESTSSSEVTATKAVETTRKSAGTSAASTKAAGAESTAAADDSEDYDSDTTGADDKEETKDAAASEASKDAGTTKAEAATTAASAAGDDLNLDSR